MTTQEQIERMSAEVNSANVAKVEGRGTVAENCSKLYNLLEDEIYGTEKRWMLKGMYHDLCEGNFSTPFHCEQKRHTFNVIVEIYNKEIINK